MKALHYVYCTDADEYYYEDDRLTNAKNKSEATEIARQIMAEIEANRITIGTAYQIYAEDAIPIGIADDVIEGLISYADEELGNYDEEYLRVGKGTKEQLEEALQKTIADWIRSNGLEPSWRFVSPNFDVKED